MREPAQGKYRKEIEEFEQRMHEAFVQMLTPAGTVPSEGIQEIREGDQHPWRVGGRRLIEACESGVPEAQAKAFAREWDWFIERLYERRRQQQAGNTNARRTAGER